MTGSNRPTPGRISADRWPTEMPLFIAVVLVGIVTWLLLIVSMFGLLYAALFGLFFFASHLAFVSHLRGSGVRLGPDQFPELHQRVVELARAMDMEPPAAYLIQAGGSLNAFATRFLGRDIVVLYSDLLEACRDNDDARDMIITHELAHLRCGHLRWTWLTLPGQLVPFLGGALSRAREYTCDRFGLAGARSRSGATLGLAILSAGPAFGPQVNLRAFVDQRTDTNTGFMTLGEWFSTHPPLSKRVAALDPSLSDVPFHPGKGRVLALAIVVLVLLGGGGLTAGAVVMGSKFMEGVEQVAAVDAAGAFAMPAPAEARAQVDADFSQLSAFILREWGAEGIPESIDDLRERWHAVTGDAFPVDPFDGYEYGYTHLGATYRLWSSGPDGTSGTADDITYESSGG